MKRYFVLLLICSGVLWPLVASSEPGRAAELDDQVPFFEARNQTWHEAIAFATGAWSESLTMGLVFYEHSRKQLRLDRKLSITLTSVTVRDVLDALVQGDRNYYWVVDGKAINLLPKIKRYSPDPMEVLSSTMTSCRVDDLGVPAALGEVVAQAKEQGVRGLAVGRHKPKAFEPVAADRVSILLHGKTLRECLNAVISARPPATWMAMPSRGGIAIIGLASGNVEYEMRRKLTDEELKKMQPLDIR